MGLDVSSYCNLKKIDAVFNASGNPIDPVSRIILNDVILVYINPDFPGRADDLEDGAVYSYEECGQGWGASYRNYNIWRESLARMAGYPATMISDNFGCGTRSLHAAACWDGAEGPFSELINFSDCEGTIGAIVSAKLAKDFQDWDEKAQAVGQAFYATYKIFQGIFEYASDHGAVVFE